MVRNIFLTAVGNVRDPKTWSGIPYYLLQEAIHQDFIAEGLSVDLTSTNWTLSRWIWNANQLIREGLYGGFQYSNLFLEKLFQNTRIENQTILSCYQLLPPSLVSNSQVPKWFYIDMTLVQLFEEYGVKHTIGKKILREAINKEAEGYASALGVITHSEWAASSVTADCGVPRNKVHVVVPGASMPSALGEGFLTPSESANQRRSELRLIFVGRNWRRKGLDRLLDAVSITRRLGYNIHLDVIGCTMNQLPAKYRHIRNVSWHGLIDKATQTTKFGQILSSGDLGCLISRAEAGGIAIREYHSLGLPVLACDVGGVSDHCFPGASILVAKNATAEEVAATLLQLSENRKLLNCMKISAQSSSHTATWNYAVPKLKAILDPSRS